MERDLAEAIPCPQPGCGALAGETCTNLVSNVPLERLPAHAVRIRDAREAATRPPEGEDQ